MCDLAGALADHLKEVTWGGIYEGLRPNANCGDRFIATRDRPDESCPVRILPDVDLVHIYAIPLDLLRVRAGGVGVTLTAATQQ